MEKLNVALHHGDRLDVALSKHQKVGSRQQAKKIIQQNLVTSNPYKKLTPDYKLKASDEIFFEIIPEKTFSISARAQPLEIHYEDEYLLVVYKPAGVVVHPADSYQGVTLLHHLLAHTALSSIGANNRKGIVHRIDKNTSGLLVVAKNDNTHLSLAEQFQKHSVHRRYLCFVCSSCNKLSGIIYKNIRRHPKKRKSFEIHDTEGRTAITSWKVVRQWEAIKLVECQLKTGRTHQIRVHLNFIGLPIIGDDTYAKINKKLLQNFPKILQEKILSFPRQALHAQELGFWHPQRKQLVFCTRHLPKDLEELLAALTLNNICS